MWQIGKLSCRCISARRISSSGCPLISPATRADRLMVAQVCGLQPGEFIWTGGGLPYCVCQSYGADLSCTDREPYPMPRMHLNPGGEGPVCVFNLEDFTLEGYQAHPHIKAPVAVMSEAVSTRASADCRHGSQTHVMSRDNPVALAFAGRPQDTFAQHDLRANPSSWAAKTFDSLGPRLCRVRTQYRNHRQQAFAVAPAHRCSTRSMRPDKAERQRYGWG